MVKKGYKYLDNIDSPEELRRLSVAELNAFAQELRNFMVKELAVNPGHCGSSLGAVDLAVALHYVYNTPDDKLIWDVGHQAYAHKILTGRRDIFYTNRKLNGISGFPRMCESPYDAFGAGHASVSISAALGMAQAFKLKGERKNVVAVIGDGAMTGGLAYEGLNNAGASNADLLVVLNDNNMSISPNVGAMKEYLLSITTSHRYNKLKNKIWNSMSGVPRLRRTFQGLGNAMKQGILKHSNLFESLNFRYFGPVDGNDVKTLVRVFEDLKHIPGPKLLHVLTVKGKGYKPAEWDPPVWHAPGKFNPETGELLVNPADKKPDRYQDVFGYTLLNLARLDDRLVGVTPAMLSGSSMDILQNKMPERCFDVGIAEGHSVTFSAGLAAAGLIPFCNIYSSFSQRAYDNIIHDVAIQKLPVVLCLDRAGLVGEDGVTHHGAFDLAYLRSIPDIIIAAPSDENELKNIMYTAMLAGAPFAIRYPRGKGMGADWSGEFQYIETGTWRTLRSGDALAVLAVGSAVKDALAAAEKAAEEGINVELIDMRFIKPLDEKMLRSLGKRFRHIVTVEDGVINGGAGSAATEFFSQNGYNCRVTRLGMPDEFVQHGTMSELRNLCGYDAEGILKAIKNAAKADDY